MNTSENILAFKNNSPANSLISGIGSGVDTFLWNGVIKNAIKNDFGMIVDLGASQTDDARKQLPELAKSNEKRVFEINFNLEDIAVNFTYDPFSGKSESECAAIASELIPLLDNAGSCHYRSAALTAINQVISAHFLMNYHLSFSMFAEYILDEQKLMDLVKKSNQNPFSSFITIQFNSKAFNEMLYGVAVRLETLKTKCPFLFTQANEDQLSLNVLNAIRGEDIILIDRGLNELSDLKKMVFGLLKQDINTSLRHIFKNDSIKPKSTFVLLLSKDQSTLLNPDVEKAIIERGRAFNFATCHHYINYEAFRSYNGQESESIFNNCHHKIFFKPQMQPSNTPLTAEQLVLKEKLKIDEYMHISTTDTKIVKIKTE